MEVVASVSQIRNIQNRMTMSCFGNPKCVHFYPEFISSKATPFWNCLIFRDYDVLDLGYSLAITTVNNTLQLSSLLHYAIIACRKFLIQF